MLSSFGASVSDFKLIRIPIVQTEAVVSQFDIMSTSQGCVQGGKCFHTCDQCFDNQNRGRDKLFMQKQSELNRVPTATKALLSLESQKAVSSVCKIAPKTT